jgi:hypothetical protein
MTPAIGKSQGLPVLEELSQYVAEAAGAGEAPVVIGVLLMIASTPTQEPVDVYTM